MENTRDTICNAWSSTSDYPTNSNDQWVVRRNRGEVAYGELAVRRTIRSWHPMQTVLVGIPGYEKLLPPICLAAISESAQVHFQRRMYLVFLLWSIIAVALYMTSFMHDFTRLRKLAIVVSTFLLVITGDYFLNLRTRLGIEQRTLFFYWLQSSKRFRTGSVIYAFAMLLSGAIQFLVQDETADIQLSLAKYGLVFEFVQQGDWWRVVTGPFIHSGLVHFISNAGLIVFIGSLTYAIDTWKSIIVFIAGNIFSALFVYLFFKGGMDAYTGVSGGIFAMFGYATAHAIRFKANFPKGFAGLLFSIALLSGIAASIINPKVSDAAHISGFLCGLVLFSICPIWAKSVGRMV